MSRIDPELQAAYRDLIASMPQLRSAADISRFRRWGRAREPEVDDLCARYAMEHTEVVVSPGLSGDRFQPVGGPAESRIVFVHGGGLVAGSPRDGIGSALRLAGEIGAEVLSLRYPLAPRARLDAQVRSVEDQVRSLVRDGGQDTLLVGQSAGGAIAAACGTARYRRPLAGVMLLAPMIRPRRSAVRGNRGEDLGWSSTADAVGWAAALGDDPKAAAALPEKRLEAARRRGEPLPPWFLDCGSEELFFDDVVVFSRALQACDADVELHAWSGGFHGFDVLAEEAQVSRAAHAARVAWARRILSRQ